MTLSLTQLQILLTVRPDQAIYCTLGNFLQPLAANNFPKLPTFNFCKAVKIFNFSSGQFYRHLAIFYGHTNPLPWSSLVEGVEQTDRPKSQTSVGVLPYVYGINFLGDCHKHNSSPLGPIQPSSHSTKEVLRKCHCCTILLRVKRGALQSQHQEQMSSTNFKVAQLCYTEIMVKISHMTCSSQSDCFISAQRSCTTLKLL